MKHLQRNREHGSFFRFAKPKKEMRLTVKPVYLLWTNRRLEIIIVFYEHAYTAGAGAEKVPHLSPFLEYLRKQFASSISDSFRGGLFYLAISISIGSTVSNTEFECGMIQYLAPTSREPLLTPKPSDLFPATEYGQRFSFEHICSVFFFFK